MPHLACPPVGARARCCAVSNGLSRRNVTLLFASDQNPELPISAFRHAGYEDPAFTTCGAETSVRPPSAQVR
jgi:hypothetical protein